MATATKVPSDYEVTLKLNRKEAEALRQVTGSVAGSFNGTRGLIANIYDALELAGVEVAQAPKRVDEQTIYFID